MNRLYQIYDKKAESVVGPIMSCKADAVAIRAFSDNMRQADSPLAQHPEDFDLLLIGEQGDSGHIYNNERTETLMQGLVMHQLLNAPKDAQ